jgi:hypothetical protein
MLTLVQARHRHAALHGLHRAEPGIVHATSRPIWLMDDGTVKLLDRHREIAASDDQHGQHSRSAAANARAGAGRGDRRTRRRVLGRLVLYERCSPAGS